jgi:hypothetical protein
MANPTTFINSYSANIAQLVSLMQTLRTQNDQIDQDPSLIEEYFDPPETPPLTTAPPQPPRTDIVAEDVTAAHDAIVQLLFAFDSGEPPQKAALYQMLP